MTDFITAPAIVATCAYTFYKFVEILVRRKERLLMLDKITELSTANDVDLSKIFGDKSNGSTFIALRFGAGFLGIGLGLLIGFIIAQCVFGNQFVSSSGDNYWRIRESIGIIYGSSTLIFGGLGLLLCFMMEQKYRKG